MPSSSSHFVGRSEQLALLKNFFKRRKKSDRARRAYVLYGVGGVGKTQTCLKFVEESRNLCGFQLFHILMCVDLYFFQVLGGILDRRHERGNDPRKLFSYCIDS